jgi:hypothetical protein
MKPMRYGAVAAVLIGAHLPPPAEADNKFCIEVCATYRRTYKCPPMKTPRHVLPKRECTMEETCLRTRTVCLPGMPTQLPKIPGPQGTDSPR